MMDDPTPNEYAWGDAGMWRREELQRQWFAAAKQAKELERQEREEAERLRLREQLQEEQG